jgi:hypothetical protein
MGESNHHWHTVTPAAHFLASWAIANGHGPFDRRAYAVIVISGLLPDLDGLVYPIEWLTQGTAHELPWYSQYHHVVLHGWMGLLVVGVLAWTATRQFKTLVLCALAFLTHLLCDLVGSGGPEHEIWPLVPFWPLSPLEWSVTWQWSLDSWRNLLIALVLEVVLIMCAVRRRFTPVALLSTRWDEALLHLLGRIFVRPRHGSR